MKKAEIVVGGIYVAKVSGKLTKVRVDEIREVDRQCMSGGLRSLEGKTETRYDVTNLTTGRQTTFRSAAKFRSEVKPVAETPAMNLKGAEREYLKAAGYEIGPRGNATAAGVVCKCPDNFCPAHGKKQADQDDCEESDDCYSPEEAHRQISAGDEYGVNL